MVAYLDAESIAAPVTVARCLVVVIAAVPLPLHPTGRILGSLQILYPRLCQIQHKVYYSLIIMNFCSST